MISFSSGFTTGFETTQTPHITENTTKRVTSGLPVTETTTVRVSSGLPITETTTKRITF